MKTPFLTLVRDMKGFILMSELGDVYDGYDKVLRFCPKPERLFTSSPGWTITLTLTPNLRQSKDRLKLTFSGLGLGLELGLGLGLS